MAISQTKYVEISTATSKKSTTSRRELIGRFFTSSDKLERGEIVSFDALAKVLARFGETSREYQLARRYFAYVSDKSRRPQKISFANYHPIATKAMLQATKQPAELATIKEVTAGSVKVDINGVATIISELDFSEVEGYADIAALLQTKIRAVTENGEAWTDAVVSYDATSGFSIQSGKAGEGAIGCLQNDGEATIATMLALDAENEPTITGGLNGETAVECVSRVMNLDNDCGSFAFVDDLTTEDITQLAAWTHHQNVQYMYSVGVNSLNYNTIYNAVKDYDGVALTYSNDGYGCYMCMAIMAGTDYDVLNGSYVYMYIQFPGETASVFTDELSDELDSKRINYYGSTQNAGKSLAFYQRGLLQGSIHDMGVYANEIWLKSEIVVLTLNLFINRNKIPATDAGKGIMRAALQSVIEKALNNGTIVVGKEITADQKAYVLELTDDDEAYVQIEQSGYWLKVEIVEVEVNGVTEHHLKYTLLYSKGDSIRKLEGLDVLI